MISSIKQDDQDNHKLNETRFNRQASIIALLITYQKAFHIWKSLYLYSNRNVINKIFPQWITQNLF
jgi:hypothetical protein